jgi:DNA-binding GntR family transcriptional regulator
VGTVIIMVDPRRYRQIYQELSARISSGAIEPGARLNIGLLADEFDAGRDTVQKALGLLEQDELVERYAGLGWYVRD